MGSKGAAEPARDRDAEAHFAAFPDGVRDIALEGAAEEPFALVPSEFHGDGEACAPFDEMVIEEGLSDFE